jgi:hypothetical protein
MMYGTSTRARPRESPRQAPRSAGRDAGLHRVLLLGLPARAGDAHRAGRHGTHLYLRQQAVARILLDNVDHVGASWVTQGPRSGRSRLRFGADDFGSVMFEENVVSSAGTTFCMNARDGASASGRPASRPSPQRSLRLAHAPRVRSCADARRPCRRRSSPGDADPIRDGAVVVDADGTVVDVGRPRTCSATCGRCRRARARRLLPGARQRAHAPRAQRAARSRPGGGGFVPWVERLIGARARTQPRRTNEAIERAVAELDAFGTAAVGEVTNSLAAVRALARAASPGASSTRSSASSARR